MQKLACHLKALRENQLARRARCWASTLFYDTVMYFSVVQKTESWQMLMAGRALHFGCVSMMTILKAAAARRRWKLGQGTI